MIAERQDARPAREQPSSGTSGERSTRLLGQAMPRQGRGHAVVRTVRSMPKLILFASLVLIVMVVSAVLAPLVAPHDPLAQVLVARLAEPMTKPIDGGVPYLFGTDHLGRDLLSRVIYGARVSIGIAVLGMLVGLVVGTTLGLISGFAGGLADTVIMFLVDVQQAIPFMIVALAGIALFGTDLTVLVVMLGLAGWDGFARFARGMTLGMRNREYVVAAQLLGQSTPRIIVRHVLPNILAPLIVLATLNITGIIMLESSLSFLGIGVQPPQPSWGSMVGEGRQYLNSAWWIAVFPGAAIVLITISVNLLGDWLRDVLDPTLKGGR